ncbi:MAG: transcriptional regulator, partial [Frankiales bacterium]|nr:transcriptional regulator [Frankiales bacterium]
GLPLSAALPTAADAPDAIGEAVDVWLVERSASAGRPVEVHRLRLRVGQEQWSAPHAPGVTEQVLLVTGRAAIGPEGAELGPGETLTYDGARPHLWRALGSEPASALLVMRYP